jgi:CheY-like chemotaxis protein
VGRLAGGVAHDFNNLLTVILGFCDMLGEQTDDAGMLADLGQIRKAGERARALTRQLLAFSRRQLMELRRTNLNRVVLDCAEMLKRLLGENIVVHTELAPALGDVHGDPSQLTQIIMNLAINARDAMAPGGVLTVRTEDLEVPASPLGPSAGPAPGAHVCLTVADTGSGMDAETQKHVFEPFFTTKEVGKGSGLGLATVYGIVRQHSGNITFESRLGQGTTFSICLPRLPPGGEADESPASAAPDLAKGTETLLLVEDDEGVREMAEIFLTRYGYRVLAADTPSAALRLAAAAERLDLLLTDVIMPEMNGRDLYERTALTKPGLRVLFMSGYARDILSPQGSLDEGLHFLAKPFTAAALAAKVREVLDQPAPGGQDLV